ncbi:hypothetical protein CPC08DRAFT_707949 [Agrocybe pediades]|nr:hypothetical protein CPC08DRAFT_707949 [Agrocybe pediades]
MWRASFVLLASISFVCGSPVGINLWLTTQTNVYTGVRVYNTIHTAPPSWETVIETSFFSTLGRQSQRGSSQLIRRDGAAK